MTGYVGLCGLFAVVIVIVLLFLQRKQIEKGVGDFYRQHGFVTDPVPPIVQEALGGKWICFRVGIVTTDGGPVSFHWLEGHTTSTTVSNNIPQTTLNTFLAFSFAPGTVSAEFVQKTIEWKNASDTAKDLFVLNTEKPIRAEMLGDGTFLIVWRTLDRADMMNKNLEWLKANLTIVKAKVEEPQAKVKNKKQPPKVDVLVPIPELFATLDEAENARARLVMQILSYYYMDYHDYKSNPIHDYRDFAKEIGLTKEEEETVGASLQHGRGYPREYIAQFYSENTGPGNWEGFDLTFGGREFAFVTARDMLIDLETGTLYKN